MRRYALFAALLLTARAARAGEIVVVAPDAPMPPYQEALRGICDELGECPTVLSAEAGADVPADARVVIALGGKAARLRYPSRTTVVTALTPGYEARARGAVVRVRLTYAPADFARKLKTLRPEARRAALLWSEPASGRFAREVRAAAAALGLDAVVVQVSNPEELPALLRSLPATDAVWLAPDPQLVTPVTFDAAREYARSSGAAFFAPAPGLTERGAEPGLAPSFRAVGLRAGAAARAALAGRPSADEAYPDDAPIPGRDLIVSTKTVEPSR
jgi:hypothetical protein